MIKLDLSKLINKNLSEIKKKSHGGEIYNTNMDKANILDFSTNINHLFNLKNYQDILNKAINEINRYPDSTSRELKKSLCFYFQEKIKPENLIISSGSTELIDLFSYIFIQNKNRVVIYQPTFSEYEWATRKYGGSIVNVFRLPENNFQINIKDLKSILLKKPKCVFICNPNNPNGSLDHCNVLEDFIAYAMDENVIIFLDEAFIEFAGEKNSLVPSINKFKNLFIARTFTKFFGIPGLRIGFGCANPEIINKMNKAQNPWSVNIVAQKIAGRLIKSKETIRLSRSFFRKEREYVKGKLGRIKGLKIYPSETNYLLITIKETNMKSKILKKKMLEHNILIRDCSNYDGLDEYYFRIAIRSRDLNNKLINVLTSIFKESKSKI